MSNSERGIIAVLMELLAAYRSVIGNEVSLIKVEVSQKANRAVVATTILMVGAVLALLALILLLQAATHALIEQGFTPAMAFLTTGGGALALALVLILIGLRGLKPRNLVPTRSLEKIRSTLVSIKDQLHL